MGKKLEAGTLSRHFEYDETSASCLRWRADVFCGEHGSRVLVAEGDAVGTVGRNGYWVVGLRGKKYQVHRIVWSMHNGDIPTGAKIDHIDGDRANNRLSNLRLVDSKGNSRNSKMPSHNTSGVCGVSYYEKLSGEKLYQYWRAVYHCPSTGRHVSKSFPVPVLGYEEAFRKACDWRASALQKLNEAGAGYTGRHGT